MIPRFHALLFALMLAVHTAALQAGTYAGRPEVNGFIDEMVEKHGFERAALETLFGQVEKKQSILDAISRPAEAKPWHEYRPIFLTPSRIDGGVQYWRENRDVLDKAAEKFGVDPRVVVAIIGVETRYGRHAGRYRVADALATLAFDYPPRAKFFRSELEQFLLLTREERVDPLEAKGSYAGAMGHGQFIPSSYREYAVDFDGDGHRDLWHSRYDIIGSVANYLSRHGWQHRAPVAHPGQVSGNDYHAYLDKGLKPATPLGKLRAAGVRVADDLPDDLPAALLELEGKHGPEYWVGFNNFYVITRYNRSPLYAMAVHQLSEEIEKQYLRADDEEE